MSVVQKSPITTRAVSTATVFAQLTDRRVYSYLPCSYLPTTPDYCSKENESEFELLSLLSVGGRVDEDRETKPNQSAQNAKLIL